MAAVSREGSAGAPPLEAPKGGHPPFARGGGRHRCGTDRVLVLRAPGSAQHRPCPCWPAVVPSPSWPRVLRLQFPKGPSYPATPCPSVLEGFPLPKCIHLKHLLESSASFFDPSHNIDPLFRPLGTPQTHFDSALPCSDPLPSAGQAGVTCSDLSGLSCLPLPSPLPPPAQPHSFHAIRLLQVR